MKQFFPLFVLVISLFLAINLCAQNGATSVRGVVSDANGAVVPNSTVTISSPANGFSQTKTTDASGNYQFLQLQPGSYVVRATAQGFAETKHEPMNLLVNVPYTINLTMGAAGASTIVEVKGDTLAVNTTDATIGNAFTTEQVLNLPFEGRNPAEVLSLEPGVTFIGNQVNDAIDTRNGAVNGGRSDQANITLDGVDNNDQTRGTAFTGAIRSTLDSVQEFRVTTAGENADQGRSSGGQVALVTKSGTNSFHGSLYEYHRPTIAAANDWFNKQSQLANGQPNSPPKVLRNTFGGAIGGPIWKNRLFFFGTYEGQRKAEAVQVTRAVPGLTLRAGSIAYPTAAGGTQTLTSAQIASMDPNCTGNGTCPLGPGPDPAVVALFNKYPLPNSNACGNADGFNISCFTFASPSPERLNTFIAKLDYNLNASGTHRLFVRGNLQNDRSSSAEQFPGLPAASVLAVGSKAIAAGYTATLSNNLINVFRYGFTRQSTANAGQQTQQAVSFRFIDDLSPLTSTRSSHIPVNNWIDDVTWVKGKHTMQFGTNIRLIDNIRSSNATSFNGALLNPLFLPTAPAGHAGSLDPGAFGFPAVDPNNLSVYNNSIVDLVGIITQATSNFNRDKTGAVLPQGAAVPRSFRAWEFEWYAQDSWKVTPHLTFNYGLRYTILQPPYETTGTQAAPTFSLNNYVTQRGLLQQQGKVFDPGPVTFDLSGQANGKQPYWDYDYKDFGPRAGFAYGFHADHGLLNKIFGSEGKSSLRGGYSLVYDHFGQGIVNTFDQNGTFGLTTSVTNTPGQQTVDGGQRFSAVNVIPACASGCPNGALLTPPPSGAPFPATPPLGGLQIAFGLDDKLKTPYAHVVNLTFDRELPGGFVLETSYVGRFAHRLLQQRDLAMPLDLVDPKSGTDYFAAATLLSKAFYANTPVANIAPIPYWENLFPTAAGVNGSSCGDGTPGNGGAPGNGAIANPTATQSMYENFYCNTGPSTFGESSAIFNADGFCFPGCATINGVTAPFQYYNSQYSALYAWSSTGNSAYHAGEITLRARQHFGITADFNYTFSKSIDIGSDAERVPTFGGLSAVINTWSPNQLRAPSDFDARHQINTNWFIESPFGRGKRFGSNANLLVDSIFGGWNMSGVYRWTSGFPFSVGNGGIFVTNFQLSGNVFTNGTTPATGTTIIGGLPNVFPNGGSNTGAITDFRYAFPGESGQRNNLRGDGFFGIDVGVGKTFPITEHSALKIRAEAFNVTNSVRFDVQSISANLQNSATFGQYSSTLTKPRVMQFSIRYEF